MLTILNIGQCHMHDYTAWAQRRFRLISRQNVGQAAISKRRPTSSSLSLWPTKKLWSTIRGVTLRPCSRTSSPTIRTLHSLETLQWQIRHGKSGKTFPSVGGSASLTSPSGAPLLVVGFHLRTTFKRRSPFSPACTASTSPLRPGACLKSCVSPSQGINLIHGTRMHMTPEPISGFALSSPFLRNKTGGRRWITDVKASGLEVPS